MQMDVLDFLNQAGAGAALGGFLVFVVFLFMPARIIEQLPSKRTIGFFIGMCLVVAGFTVSTIGGLGG